MTPLPFLIGFAALDWLLCLVVIVDARRIPDAAWQKAQRNRGNWVALAAAAMLLPLPGLGLLVPAVYLAARPDPDSQRNTQ